MFTSHEDNCGILYDRWYNEMDEEKQVLERASHIIKQQIHGMVYDSYTYPEPMSITFAAPETIVYNVIRRRFKK